MDMQAMISDLSALIRIPSKNAPAVEEKPFGQAVHDALEFCVRRAKELGLEAKNLGYAAEISFGDGPDKIYIATHTDVVPEGDGWTCDPFGGEVRDGKVWGRGAIDDKGPTIAVLHALATLKAEGFVPKTSIKFIIGGDEEIGMSDLKQYVATYGYPDFALSPDSAFPVTNAELGVMFARFRYPKVTEDGPVRLLTVKSGYNFNSVPDRAVATLTCPADVDLTPFCSDRVRMTRNGDTVEVEALGKTAHGSVPYEGINAFFLLASACRDLMEANGSCNGFLSFAADILANCANGAVFGIACKDTMSGTLSCNVGIIEYENGVGMSTLDIRVPVSCDVNDVHVRMQAFADANEIVYEDVKSEKGTHMDENNPYLQKLAKVYAAMTGDTSKPFVSSRGATYAKAFDGHGVAFGAEAPWLDTGEPHISNEYISIDALQKVAEIYYQTIKELF